MRVPHARPPYLPWPTTLKRPSAIEPAWRMGVSSHLHLQRGSQTNHGKPCFPTQASWLCAPPSQVVCLFHVLRFGDHSLFLFSLIFSPGFLNRHVSQGGNEQDQCRIALALSGGLWMERKTRKIR